MGEKERNGKMSGVLGCKFEKGNTKEKAEKRDNKNQLKNKKSKRPYKGQAWKKFAGNKDKEQRWMKGRGTKTSVSELIQEFSSIN